MKKQITVLVVVFASFYFFSCQKEALTPEENINSAAVSPNATGESSMTEKGVPFKGSYETSHVMLQPPPNLIQRVSGTGIASHLGQSTFEATSHVTVSFPPPFTVTGTRTITAANGDKIFTTFAGTSTPLVNGMNGADLRETITGGTGRFSNASGSFTTRARNNLITSTFRTYFEGYIKY